MSDNSPNGHSGSARKDTTPARRRSPWPLAVVAALFVIVPFLSWYGTWFGRTLSDEDIERYLSEGKPRHAQHALSQIAERISKGDEGVRRWHPQIVSLSESLVPDVRMTAAWVMGEEHKSKEFHAALLRLAGDPEPIVRRNAALALVRFGDARSRPELLAMLRPYAVKAPQGGVSLTALSEGTPVKRESLLVKARTDEGQVFEVRSPLPGKVERALTRDGERFAAGGDLFFIAPDAEQVRDALVGLYFFGEGQDLAEVERFAGGVEGMPDEVKRQAELTAEAIKRRPSPKQ